MRVVPAVLVVLALGVSSLLSVVSALPAIAPLCSFPFFLQTSLPPIPNLQYIPLRDSLLLPIVAQLRSPLHPHHFPAQLASPTPENTTSRSFRVYMSPQTTVGLTIPPRVG
ncbi:hypothetical protein C8R41DRAFT_32264 [Lentinula lateritia]|uniref:Secreted protein n=1 Tax=Lentinula lateritia TaxID=40482 RepID=A0ABQ8VTE2_9AGAR|nr:hypothetical protein C8R41DRAFT_32264 [Lentinula lateritia]